MQNKPWVPVYLAFLNKTTKELWLKQHRQGSVSHRWVKSTQDVVFEPGVKMERLFFLSCLWCGERTSIITKCAGDTESAKGRKEDVKKLWVKDWCGLSHCSQNKRLCWWWINNWSLCCCQLFWLSEMSTPLNFLHWAKWDCSNSILVTYQISQKHNTTCALHI